MRSKARTKKPSPPTHARQSSSNAPANLLFSSSLWMSRRNPDKHRKRMQDCGLWLCGFDHGLKPNGQGTLPAWAPLPQSKPFVRGSRSWRLLPLQNLAVGDCPTQTMQKTQNIEQTEAHIK